MGSWAVDLVIVGDFGFIFSHIIYTFIPIIPLLMDEFSPSRPCLLEYFPM